jgi:single-strand DNA-binding protein
MNKIFISGNLTRDPEVRYTGSGKSYAKMGIAVQRYKKKDGTQEVDFFNMTAWDKTAEFCGKYLRKGSSVIVEGRLETSNYEAKDGTKRTGYDINVLNIEFAGSSKRSEDGESGNYQNNYKNEKPQDNSANEFDRGFSGEDVAEEDVPF